MKVTEETQARESGRLAAAWRSGPLGVRGFRLLTFGQFASTVGDNCYAVALPWLVLSGGGSAASLGVVLACYGVPRALLTVLGGSLTDRFSPRLVMLSADFGRCGLTTVLAVLAAVHVSSLAALAPVAVLLGACSALFMPASMAMMPSLVDSAQLTSANSVYAGFVQAGSMSGQRLAGCWWRRPGRPSRSPWTRGRTWSPRPASCSSRPRRGQPRRAEAPEAAESVGAAEWPPG